MNRRWTLSVTVLVALALSACAGTQKPCAPCAAAPAPAPTVISAPPPTPAWPQHGDARFVTLVVQWKFKAEAEQEALAYIRSFIAKAHANEPNLVLYTLNKDPKAERTYYWVERYRDRAALEFHRSREYRNEAIKLIPTWLEKWPPAAYLELEQVIPN